MNIVLVDPIAVTPAFSATSIVRPRVPSLAEDPQAIREINLVELGAAIAHRGHSVTVVLGDLYLDGRSWEISPELRVVPVDTFMRAPFHPALLPMTPGLLSHGAFRDADVIQSGEFHQPSTFFACVAAHQDRIPLVIWQETFTLMRFPGSWYQRFYEKVVGSYVRTTAQQFVPRTTKAQAFLEDLGVGEEAIGPWIPTGIDVQTYKPVRSRFSPGDFGWREGDRVLLLVARLHPAKGVDLALQVLKWLRRQADGVRLLVRGSGPELGNLRQLAGDLGIADSVRFLGRVSREDLVHLYSIANLVLCTSRNDLLPFTLMEGSACGRPCLTTDVGSVRDIVVDGETGVVSERRKPEDVGNAILSLLEDSEVCTQYGTAARERIEARFSLPKVAEDLLGVYRGVCS